MPELAAIAYQSKNNASGQFQSGIGGSDLTINLKSGEGAEFPQALSGAATSAGDSATLNSTGIQAAGVAVGDIIYNLTDGSQAVVKTVSTNSVTTTILRGGSGNTWDDTDVWTVNPFLVTLNSKDTSGGVASITAYEIAIIIARSGDILTVKTGGRGAEGTSAQTWLADDYVELFVVSSHNSETIKMQADILFYLDSLQELKADLTTVNSLLDARNWKSSCRAGTTAAGTLASDFENGDTIDGVVLATGDRILIKDQADATENGIYTVNASGAPTRADDFNESDEIAGAVVFIEEGTANADFMFVCTNNGSVNIGVDNIVFTQFTGGLTKASQAEAEAGANDTKYMTPLLTKYSIDALAGNKDSVFLAQTVSAGEVVGFESPPTEAQASSPTLFGANSASEKKCWSILGNGQAMGNISAVFSKAGTPADNLTIRIETDNSGEPSGTLADANASATIAGASLSASLTLKTVTWGGAFTLTKNTKYWIVLGRSGAVDASNYYNVGIYNSFPACTNGFSEFGVYNSGVWGSFSKTGGTPHFTYGGGISQPIVKTQASSNLLIDPIGIAAEAITELNSGLVTFSGVDRNQSGLDIGQTYYLSNTAGAISTTAGTNSVKIGKAIDDDSIFLRLPDL